MINKIMMIDFSSLELTDFLPTYAYTLSMVSCPCSMWLCEDDVSRTLSLTRVNLVMT